MARGGCVSLISKNSKLKGLQRPADILFMSVQPIELPPPTAAILACKHWQLLAPRCSVATRDGGGRCQTRTRVRSIALRDFTSAYWPAIYAKGQLTPIPPQVLVSPRRTPRATSPGGPRGSIT